MIVGLTRPTTGAVRVLGAPYASWAWPATVAGVVLEVRSAHPRAVAIARRAVARAR
jgi:hypothetical protein